MGNSSSVMIAEEETKRTQAEEETKKTQAEEETKRTQAEEQTKRIQAEETSKIKIKEIEKESEIARMKAEKDLEKQRQEHEETLKQMKISAEKADKEMKIEQKKEALAKIAKFVENTNTVLDKDKEELIIIEEALGSVQASLEKNKTDIEEFPEKKVREIDIYKNKKEIDFDKKKRDFERDDEEIRQAIETTGQTEEGVGKFLRLTHNLVGATMVTQINANSLDTTLKTANELITTISNDRLTVENYFADKRMSRFVPILAAEDMHDLDDLVCPNDDTFNEDILELIQTGLKEALAEWQKKHNDDSKNDNDDGDEAPRIRINGREKRILKMICLESEKTWIKHQNRHQDITKRSLMSVSPVLGKFFGGCYEGMNQVQKMLSLSNKLNDTQRKAIKMIENGKDDDDDDADVVMKDNDDEELIITEVCIEDVKDDDDDVKDNDVLENARDLLDVDSDVQSSTETDTINVDVQRGSDKVKALAINKMIAEQKSKTDELVVECRALSKAATYTVSVIETMEEDFEKDIDTIRSKSIAVGVEYSCKHIISSQGSIRQSVLLAQKILSLKPSNMKNESTQKLWNCLDESIIHIFKSAVEMVDVSVKYFSFFLLFRNGFEFFQSCYKDGNYEDTDLIVSCQYIRKHTRQFCEFSKEFSKIVERLRNDAMNCIESCVKTQKGYECFENKRKSRKRTVDLYLVAKAKVDAFSYEQDQKLEDYRIKRTSLCGKEKRLMCKQTMLQNRIKHNEEYLINLERQNDYFMKLDINNNNNNKNESRKRRLSDNERNNNNNKKRKLG